MNNDSQNIQEEEDKNDSPAFITRLLRWLRRGVLVILTLFILLVLLIQIPVIQNYIVKKVTASLSKTLDTKVSIDYVKLTFFDEFQLKGFYVEDYYQDTLLYSQKLTANIDFNPFSWINQGLGIEEITLTGARLKLRRPEGEEKDNLTQILNRLIPPDTIEKERRPFHLNLGALILKDVHFEKDDQVKGSYMNIYVPDGRFYFNEFNLPDKRIDARMISLDALSIKIANFQAKPLPTARLTAIVEPDSTALLLDTLEWQFSAGKFQWKDGTLEMANYRKEPVKLTAPGVLNLSHFQVFDIELAIEDFSAQNWHFAGRVEKLTLEEETGFILEELSAIEATVTPTQAILNDVALITPYSHLGDTLIFNYSAYPDFEQFPELVDMDIRLNNAAIAIRDILIFAPKLNENAFFRSNQEEVLRIDGRLSGEVSSLRGDDLNLELADGSRLIGDFRFRNLTQRNEEFLSLRKIQLNSSIRTLRQLIPGFNPPPNFDKLGRILFNGRFDGFFSDFVADGNLRTELGSARMDMRMNLKEGRDRASYSGNLSLSEFDLGAWTDNPNFGKVSIRSQVINGSGLGETARAILISNIESFNFKGYNYQNAYLEGELRWNQFNGVFSIEDENIDFGFRGEIDLSEGVPSYEFVASIERLDLKNLNLSQKDIVLNGDIQLDLRNLTLADLEGTARVSKFNIQHNQDSLYVIDSVLLSSIVVDSAGNRQFQIQSDILDVDISGQFDVQQVPEALIRYFHRNFPNFSHHLGIKPSGKPINPNQFKYNLTIKDTKGINRIFNEQLGDLVGVQLKGQYDSVQDSLFADLEVPKLQFGKVELMDIYVNLDAIGDQGDLEFAVDSTLINKKTGFSSVALLSFLDKDTLTFGITYDAPDAQDSPYVLEEVNLDGRLFVLDSNYMQAEFYQSRLVILQSFWNISDQNYIRFGNKTVETKDFRLTRNEQEIKLESVGRKGLKLSLLNLDFSYIDEVWDYDPLDFSGNYDVYALTQDVFELKNISLTAESDTFYVNNDDWGTFRLDALAQDLSHPINAYLSITKDTSQLIAEGTFNPKAAVGENIPLEQQQNYFDFDLNIEGYPLAFSEYFIGETVTNTVGSFSADLRLYGIPGEPNVEGNIIARDGAVTVNYLQTRYSFDISKIEVDNHLFNATGTILRDKYGHTATLFGGVRHTYLKDLGFSARLSTDRFLALDTKKENNELFYGHALGNGEIWFSGSFKQPNIYINAEVSDSTQLIIPVNAGANASELSYIRFVDRSDEQKNGEVASPAELRGVSLEMDLQITEEARVKLVFDEQAGDIIDGSGRGDIRILVPRSQEGFQMYGNYVIEEGNYLFTLYNLVNKSFRVKKGGTINWSGDAFGAEIDLVAEYKGLYTSVANFIVEYLVNASPELKNEASQSTNVDLTMHLRGELTQPIINFDVGFPNLRGALQNYTDSKLRLLKQDQNEMNKQVFGLIVAGQFIPSNINTTVGSEIIYNTVSEFVSNQLSLLLTELFSEFIEDGKVLSGIDFDIAYNQYQNVDLGEGQEINRGDELQVRLRQNFFNDRLSILVGGNIAIGSNLPTVPNSSGTFVGNDLVIEYVLNKDRSLKLRVYQLLEPDVGGGRRLEIGTGLSYRKEFDSFGEFLKSIRQSLFFSGKKKKD